MKSKDLITGQIRYDHHQQTPHEITDREYKAGGA